MQILTKKTLLKKLKSKKISIFPDVNYNGHPMEETFNFSAKSIEKLLKFI